VTEYSDSEHHEDQREENPIADALVNENVHIFNFNLNINQKIHTRHPKKPKTLFIFWFLALFYFCISID
jgi:hypothetical protein